MKKQKLKPITVKYEPVIEDEASTEVETPAEDEKQKDKKCFFCKRILTAEDDKHLCPDCKNTYGSIGAGALALCVGAAIKYREPIKKGAKIVGNAAVNFVKNRF